MLYFFTFYNYFLTLLLLLIFLTIYSKKVKLLTNTISNWTYYNNKPISEMPENLAFWLLQGSLGNYNNETNNKDDNLNKKVIFNPKYKYDTTIDYIKKILNY